MPATEAPTQEEILASLAQIVEEVTGIEQSEVTPEMRWVDDLDVDSLSMIEIVVNAEDKHGIKIPDHDLRPLRTVQHVVEYIEENAPCGA